MDQFFVFAWTIYITVTYDLMWGILSGVAVAAVLNVGIAAVKYAKAGIRDKNVLGLALNTFSSPVVDSDLTRNECNVYLNRPILCTNFLHIIKKLGNLPATVRNVNLHIGREVRFIDHTAADHLTDFIQSSKIQNNLNIQMVNLEHAPC